MNVEQAREFLLSLPHVVETQQWGDNLVFWVGDKTIGGKMFALISLDHAGVSFAATPERFAELVEVEGMRPAPYFARLSWVAAERWDVLCTNDWHEVLAAAHAITLAKLAPKTAKILALPKGEQRRIVSERRKLLAAKRKCPG